jgi:hypothetical protein
MAKWEELRRRADAAAARPAGTEPGDGPGGTAPAATDPAGRAVPLSAVDDLIQTLQDLALRQPSLSVAVIAQEPGVTWHVHTDRADGQVRVVAVRAETLPGQQPDASRVPTLPPVPTAAPDADSAIAARLAEILRTNPTMLQE